jgi:hypothetical protein
VQSVARFNNVECLITSIENINKKFYETVCLFSCKYSYISLYRPFNRNAMINDSYLCTVSTNKLHGLSPRANHTDRATAACRRNDCQLFADKGCHVVSVTDPYGRILGSVIPTALNLIDISLHAPTECQSV